MSNKLNKLSHWLYKEGFTKEAYDVGFLTLDSISGEEETATVEGYNGDSPASFFLYDDCIISKDLKDGKVWEPHMHEVFKEYIKKDDVVLEAGCHIGSHSVLLSMLCGKLILFEPMPYSAKLLEKNLKVNGLDNFILYEDGLSDKEGVTYFDYSPKGNPGASALEDGSHKKDEEGKSSDNNILFNQEGRIEVDLMTIDSLGLDRLDFIKLDIEGSEEDVIRGAFNTIEKFKPIITLEIYSDHNGGSSFENAVDKFSNLINLGYSCQRIKDSPDYLFLPPVLNKKAIAMKALTPSDVHEAADKANIDWDDNEAFMRASEALTGKKHLDDMDPNELQEMLIAIDFYNE
ncbi:MAG: FkbM family methyltransferase, partial [Pelagibacteraceae bacterium TMED247]